MVASGGDARPVVIGLSLTDDQRNQSIADRFVGHAIDAQDRILARLPARIVYGDILAVFFRLQRPTADEKWRVAGRKRLLQGLVDPTLAALN